MFRIVLCVSGFVTGVAALVIWRDQAKAMRRLPAKEAAAMLQQAWADHHTRA